MGLKKSTGNMYPWVTHTHCHLGGECQHKCVYCYVNSCPFGRPKKYCGNIRLIEKEFAARYGKGKTIFIECMNDLFAENVPSIFIRRIISHCRAWPENTYVLQTKNPGRFHNEYWTSEIGNIKGTTIETNRPIPEISNAPAPAARMLAMEKIPGRKFVTIEPVLDFDVDILASWINRIRPEFLNLGADSKKNNLPEPTVEKIHQFVDKLAEYGIELREKHNLDRLTKEGPHDDT